MQRSSQFGIITLCILWFASAEAAKSATACATFSQEGVGVGVVIGSGEATLTMTPLGGVPIELKTPITGSPAQCRVLFSPSGASLVVSAPINSDFQGGVQVLVADPKQRKWLRSFSVPSRADFANPQVIGFFEKSSLLIVRAVGGQQQTPATVELKAGLFDLDGSVASSGTVTHTIVGRLHSQFPQYWDAVHNRLWFPSFPQFCPFRSIPIIGEAKDDPSITAAVADGIPCNLPVAVAYPDAGTVVTASDREGQNVVSRVDLEVQTGEKLFLPSDHKGISYSITPRTAASSDGEVFAVERSISTRSPSPRDTVTLGGTDVAVVQVRPLRLISTIKPAKPDFLEGLAIYHGRDKTLLYVRWTLGGQWELREVSPTVMR
jgi:hypothetical protein